MVQPDYRRNEESEITFRQLMQRINNKMMYYLRSREFKKFKYESLPLVLFSFFSIYIGHTMQSQQDDIKRRVVVNKSMREEDVERENKYLEAAQKNDGYENIPIQDVEPGYRYKIQGMDDDEGVKLNVPVYEGIDDISQEDLSNIMSNYEEKAYQWKSNKEDNFSNMNMGKNRNKGNKEKWFNEQVGGNSRQELRNNSRIDM